MTKKEKYTFWFTISLILTIMLGQNLQSDPKLVAFFILCCTTGFLGGCLFSIIKSEN